MGNNKVLTKFTVTDKQDIADIDEYGNNDKAIKALEDRQKELKTKLMNNPRLDFPKYKTIGTNDNFLTWHAGNFTWKANLEGQLRIDTLMAELKADEKWGAKTQNASYFTVTSNGGDIKLTNRKDNLFSFVIVQ